MALTDTKYSCKSTYDKVTLFVIYVHDRGFVCLRKDAHTGKTSITLQTYLSQSSGFLSKREALAVCKNSGFLKEEDTFSLLQTTKSVLSPIVSYPSY